MYFSDFTSFFLYRAKFCLSTIVFLVVSGVLFSEDIPLPQAKDTIPTALIELDGSSSEDPDGDELHYEWQQIEGPKVELSDKNSAKPYFRTGKPGLYRFQLVVTDGELKSDPCVVDILIERNNQIPVAKLPVEVFAEVGKLVELDASDSYDLDGDELTYHWQVIGSVLNIPAESLNKSKLSFIPNKDGIFEIELIVSDGRSVSAPAKCQLYIKPANRAPRAVAVAVAKEIPKIPDSNNIQALQASKDLPKAIITGPRFSMPGEWVALDGRDSVANSLFGLNYVWRQKSGPFIKNFQLLHQGAVDRFLPEQEGIYEFELIVSNSDSESLPVTHKLVVAKKNDPPVAVILAPKRVAPGELVTLDATQSYDKEGSALIYKWRQTGGSRISRYIIDDKLGDSSPAFHPTVAGKYSFELIVSDGELESKPVEVDIDVVERNRPPTVSIAGRDRINVGDKLILESKIVDPDNDPVRILWRQVGGERLLSKSSNSPTLSLTINKAGTYIFELLASDGKNPPVSRKHTVNVLANDSNNTSSVQKPINQVILSPLSDLATIDTSKPSPEAGPSNSSSSGFLIPPASSLPLPSPSSDLPNNHAPAARAAAKIHPSSIGN